MRTRLERAIGTLTEENPDYDELVHLCNSLRPESHDQPSEIVAQTALRQLINDITGYLDIVREDLEKSVGLLCEAECERIVSAFDPPKSNNSIEQVANLLEQWQQIETVDPDRPFV